MFTVAIVAALVILATIQFVSALSESGMSLIQETQDVTVGTSCSNEAGDVMLMYGKVQMNDEVILQSQFLGEDSSQTYIPKVVASSSTTITSVSCAGRLNQDKKREWLACMLYNDGTARTALLEEGKAWSVSESLMHIDVNGCLVYPSQIFTFILVVRGTDATVRLLAPDDMKFTVFRESRPFLTDVNTIPFSLVAELKQVNNSSERVAIDLQENTGGRSIIIDTSSMFTSFSWGVPAQLPRANVSNDFGVVAVQCGLNYKQVIDLRPNKVADITSIPMLRHVTADMYVLDLVVSTTDDKTISAMSLFVRMSASDCASGSDGITVPMQLQTSLEGVEVSARPSIAFSRTSAVITFRLRDLLSGTLRLATYTQPVTADLLPITTSVEPISTDSTQPPTASAQPSLDNTAQNQFFSRLMFTTGAVGMIVAFAFLSGSYYAAIYGDEMQQYHIKF